MSPAPETPEARERADVVARCREIFEWQDTGLLKGGALEAFANTLPASLSESERLRRAEAVTLRQAAELLVSRTPDIAATGGASGEQALQDAHEEGYAEGLSDATGHASDVFKGVLSWLNDRDLLLPAEFPDGVTAQEIVDTLEEHEREIVASERALITAERERAEKAEQWAADWHSVVETILTVCGLSSALGGEEALAALRDHVTRLTDDLAARTGERDHWHTMWTARVKAHEKTETQARNDAHSLESALTRADALQQRVGALEEALTEVDGCFEAAYVEGLAEVLSASTDERLVDLITRRILFAREAAVRALSQTPTPNAKTEGV